MILSRIRVQGLRCFRSAIELSGLGVGAHVIHAPNESGKSTLILALARALFDRYSSRAQEILALRPWGTSLNPRVELELESGGKRLLLEKSFLDEAMSRLSEWTGERFELVAEANEADDRARQLLVGSASPRGASALGNWGLARLLWFPQARERLEPPGLDEPLRQRLLALVGATALNEPEQALVERIEAAWRDFFTPGGQPKRTGPCASARAQVDQAEKEVTDLRLRCDETSRLAEAASAYEGELSALARERLGHAQALEQLDAQMAREAEAQRALDLKRKDISALKARCATLADQRRELEQLDERISAERATAERLGPSIQAKREELERAQETSRVRLAETEELSSKVESAEQRHERSQALERIRLLASERRRLGEVVRKAEELETGLATRRAHQASRPPPPSEADLLQAEETQKRVDRLATKLEALGIEVGFVPDSQPRQVVWQADGEPSSEQRAQAGERSSFRALERGVLEIAGVGRIEIRCGAEEVGRIKTELDEARSQLARQLAKHGVSSSAHLRALRESSVACARELETLEISLRQTLRGEWTDSRVARRALESLSGQLSDLAERHSVIPEELSEILEEVAQAGEKLREARRQLKVKSGERSESEELLRNAQAMLQTLERQQEASRQATAALQAQRQARAAVLGEVEGLRAAFGEAAAELTLAEAAAASLEAKLPPARDRAEIRRRSVLEALERLSSREAAMRDKLAGARARLEEAGAEGLYLRLSQAEERLSLVQEELDRLRRREEAALHLKRLCDQRRDRASRSVVLPIEEGARARLERIRGGRSSPVKLAQDLGSMSLRGDGQEVPLEAFSWGTQEQAMLCLRLTLGELLSEQGPEAEPQLVVLDDALVNADPARQERALELIGSAARRLQVLILTVFPERYRSLEAEEHDLIALGRGARPRDRGAALGRNAG